MRFAESAEGYQRSSCRLPDRSKLGFDVAKLTRRLRTVVVVAPLLAGASGACIYR
jgi:hypothetical protein